MSSPIHVVTLSPIQQYVLRLALTDFYRRQVEILLSTAVTQGQDKVDTNLSRMEHAFRLYDNCSAGLPGAQSVKSAKPKMLQITPIGIQYIKRAVTEFDPDKLGEDSDYVDQIKRTYPKLRALINLSAEYDYTVDELRKGHIE